MRLKTLLTQPAVEPVTLDAAKAHLSVEHAADDARITNMTIAARQHIEQRMSRVIVRQQWRLFFDRFETFDLQPATVQSVEQVQYIDGDGVTQTLDSSVYTVDVPRQQLYLAYGQSWPASRAIPSAVWVDVWSGYFDAASSPISNTQKVPHAVRHAILMLVEHLYEHGGAANEMPLTDNNIWDDLIQPYKVYEVG